MTVKNILFEFWKAEETRQRREITVAEVAEATRLSRDTVTRFKQGNTNRFDGETVDKLCRFFNVPAGPIPFIVYEPGGNTTETQP